MTTAKVAVFNQSGLNGSGVGDISDENANLLSIVQKQINDGKNFEIDLGITSFTIPDLESRLSESSFFFMTDMENESPTDDAFFPESAVAILKDFVEGGGVIVMTGTSGSKDVDFLNRIFGWDLGSTSGSSWDLDTAAVAGTPFEGGPATLDSPSATDSISKGTVDGFTAIYGDETNAAVAVIKSGLGTVIFQGFDFFDSGFANDYGEGSHADGGSNTNTWVTEILPRSLNFATALADDTPDNEAKLAIGGQSSSIEVVGLGGAQSMLLRFEEFEVENVGELFAYILSEDGSKQQIARFFGLDGTKLSSDYGTEYSIDTSLLSVGEKIQFELVVNDNVLTGVVEMRDNRTAVIDFGDNTSLAVFLREESVAPNLLREDATTFDLTGYDGDDVTLNFSIFREASYNSTIGFYRTDFVDGGIKDLMTGETLKPGDEGYKEAALSRKLDVQLSAENGKTTTFSSTIDGGGFLGIFMISDSSDVATGEMLFSSMGMNGGNDHAKMLGNNTFGFEDMIGLGDRDFNDMVVKVDVV